jgi:hypothetical protein
MVDRRTFFSLVTGRLVAAVRAANAQQSGRVARVGVLTLAIGRNPLEEVFEDALGTLGWLKGRNLVIEERYAGGRHDTIAPLVAELVGARWMCWSSGVLTARQPRRPQRRRFPWSSWLWAAPSRLGSRRPWRSRAVTLPG